MPAVRIEGSRFVPPLQGGIICCDDPATPDVDEGLRDGWTLATDAALDRLAAGRLNVTHYRTGPYSATGPSGVQLAQARDRTRARMLAISVRTYGPGSGIIPELRKSVQAANARGLYVEVNLVDNWALVNGWSFFADDCAVTQAAPPERYVEWVRQVVDATGDLAVLYSLGNEGFRCGPRPEWEKGLYETAKARLREHGWPDRPVASQVSLAATRTPLDYRTFGGLFQAPPSLPDIPGMLTEDDGGDHTPEEWRAVEAQARANGTYLMFWRGTMPDREWERLLRRESPARAARTGSPSPAP